MTTEICAHQDHAIAAELDDAGERPAPATYPSGVSVAWFPVAFVHGVPFTGHAQRGVPAEALPEPEGEENSQAAAAAAQERHSQPAAAPTLPKPPTPPAPIDTHPGRELPRPPGMIRRRR